MPPVCVARLATKLVARPCIKEDLGVKDAGSRTIRVRGDWKEHLKTMERLIGGPYFGVIAAEFESLWKVFVENKYFTPRRPYLDRAEF